MRKHYGSKTALRISIIVLLLSFSCTEQDYQMLEWMTDYYMGGSQQATGTSLKLTVRDGNTEALVNGALIQVAGRDNDIFRQVQTNSNGVVNIPNLVPGVYTIRAWKGSKWAEDEIYINKEVSALMIIR